MGHRQHLRAVCAVAAAILAIVWGLGEPLTAAPKGPKIREGGFKADLFGECGYQGHPPKGGGRDKPARDMIIDIECSPGGPWGPYVYLIVTKIDIQGDWYSLIERVDFGGSSATWRWGPKHRRAVELNFGPPGWREGDVIFETSSPVSLNYSSTITAMDPNRTYLFSRSRIEAGVGSVAVDPTGAFDFDWFYQASDDYWGGVRGTIRVDAGFVDSLFSPEPYWSEMRFGPGGPWGSDLYVAGRTFAPDGTETAFQVPFTEFDWAFGPGLDGDMFAYISGEDPQTLFRVKADGTATPFVTDVSGVIAGCDDALWVATRDGCYVIRKTGPK